MSLCCYCEIEPCECLGWDVKEVEKRISKVEESLGMLAKVEEVQNKRLDKLEEAVVQLGKLTEELGAALVIVKSILLSTEESMKAMRGLVLNR